MCQALHVQQAAGAAILIVASHEGNEPITGIGLDVESVTIPVLGIDRDLGRNLQSVVELGPVKVLVPAYDASLKEKRNLGYVSDFSSRGPTFGTPLRSLRQGRRETNRDLRRRPHQA